jgi:preprotein translocase subunit SecD
MFCVAKVSVLGSGLLWALIAVSLVLQAQDGSARQKTVQKLTLSQIEGLVAHGVPDSTMAGQIQRRGVGFAVTPAILDALQRKGAGPQTLAAIQGIAPTSGASIPDALGNPKNANGSSPSGGWRQASDLQHCVHLILQVVVQEAVGVETQNTIARLQRDLKSANIGFLQAFMPDWSGRPGLLEVDGVAPKNLSSVRAVLSQKYSNEYDIESTGEGIVKLTMKPLAENALGERTVQQAIKIIRGRLDVLGLREAFIQKDNQRADRILVELPVVGDLDHVKGIIQSTARLAIHAVKGDSSGYSDEQSALAAIGGVLPPDEMIVHGSLETDRVFVLQRVAIVVGSDFRSAEPGVEQNTGHPIVSFTLTNDAGNRFYDFTRANIGKRMAVMMGGRVREVAVIQSAIRDSGEINGSFTPDELTILSKILRTGALPASVNFLEDRNVCSSSSLGPTR